MPRSRTLPEAWTLADLLEQIGDVAPHRIRVNPAPGTATEKDLLRIHNREDRLYELVDGTLVEKVMGYAEGYLALWLGHLLQNFLDRHDLGVLAGADGTIRLMPRLVRIPDVSFTRWDQLPGRELPSEPIPDLAPDLAVEVLSKGNTPSEMQRKLKDYFLAGIRLVWFVDPAARTVEVFTAPDQSTVLTEGQTLDGGDVLPGLELPLRQVFARVPRSGAGRRSAKGKPRRRNGR